MSITAQSSFAPKIGFASHQNSVAILLDLKLVNEGAEPLDDFVVSLVSKPPFLESKTWKVDRLDEGSELRVQDREVKLDATYLADLVENVRGTIDIEVRRQDAQGELVFRDSHEVELLSKTHWGGTGSMPELLPAFCMPNDPAVDKILKAASDVLRRARKDGALDGYESRSKSRTWEMASAVWSAVGRLGLSYALPQASFETSGQKIRTPGAILEGGVATCLDTTMLFASALEQAGLNPVVVLSKGHACVGVWLQPQEFSQLTLEEALAVRKRVELEELLVFETTLVTQSPLPAFSQAVEAAVKQLADDTFHMAIDIRRARMRKIRPLGFTHSKPVGGSDGAKVEAPTTQFEPAPPLGGFTVDVTSQPETPDDRIALWQRKLLDLTSRNRLLHLPPSSKHVPLECPDPGELEDMLAAGKIIRIVAFPDLTEGGRDASLYQRQNREELRQQYALEALRSHELMSTLPAGKLEGELVDLYRKANTDLAEGGANTLFLALGFLKWKKTSDDTRQYRAPLILQPVVLKRKSALSGVTMTSHEDEPRFNLTLLELLRQDFDLHIAGLDGALPEDGSGIDVIQIWNRVRVAVKEIPGFEVTTEMALSTFSFSKYLMWKDLTDRREELTRNAVVKHLIERGESSFETRSEFPRPGDLDQLFAPSELYSPLSADSSQLAAVAASGRGCDFVLDGPPGTGKSQTIANMIVHNLAMGRRVLFVAEKMAALEVVHRRLAERGLGEFCLEVHSHKTSKTDILQQLDRAWAARGDLSEAEWQRETSRLRALRDRLNQVCERLHARHPNGMSIHQAIGLCVRDHGPGIPQLSWGCGVQHGEQEFQAMRDVAHRLDLNLEAFRDAPENFSIIESSDWSNGWQESLSSAVRRLPDLIRKLRDACDQLLGACQFNLEGGTESEIERLLDLARVVLRTSRRNLECAFQPGLNDRLDAARQMTQLLGDYRDEEAQLSTQYAEGAAGRIDVDEVESSWAEADEKFWFLASLAKKKVARKLALDGGTKEPPDVPNDIPRLRRLGELLGSVTELERRLGDFPGCAGLSNDLGLIEETASIATDLQGALTKLVKTPAELVALKAAVRSLVVETNELLEPDGAMTLAVGRLEGCLNEFRAGYQEFSTLAGAPDSCLVPFVELVAACEAISESEPRLRSWCNWRRVRQEAIQLNLGPLVMAIEDGSLHKGDAAPAFMTAYAKWFASTAIDREPLLREFVSAEHMDSIKEFRSVDEKVGRLAVEYTRAVLAGKLPAREDVGRKDGYGILKHELQKQRRHKPLRQLAQEMGDAFGRLAPCMLMSPLSIAQYLPPDQQLFDLVIFDEASQIAPWDAVGSIARGKQVVIAGDPRQMPPTNFFQRNSADAEQDSEVEADLESILDECLAVGITRHSLNWHYRSRHESLIAFSNHRYYDGNLVTFPAAETKETAVTWRRVDGIYAKGLARTNQMEAEAIVAETIDRLRDEEFAASGKSIGIITLNADQQKLIENLLDSARKQHPEIERFFDQTNPEPVVVKNLETVQGDERDVILLGIGYGPTEPGAGTMSMNFGPLNREGGERRLNVALTRSRREMIVFTSFDPSMINLNRTSARAIRDLKHFLEFADRGPVALAEAVEGSLGGYESAFEEAVAGRLREKGWEVVPQVGVSKFRIDLGIVHPERPGDFLAGVECDGATYHSAATARDRDKVRAAVLEGLGWKLVRVWSTDWFVDPQGEIEKLDRKLRELRPVRDIAQIEEPVVSIAPESPVATEGNSSIPSSDNDSTATLEGPGASATGRPTPACVPYRAADLSEFADRINADRFYEDAYVPVLIALVTHVLESESPVADDLLIRRIARAHGFKRVGRLIRERLLDVLDQHFHLRKDPVEGAFVWLSDEPSDGAVPIRQPDGAESNKSIEEIPCEEIWSAVELADGGDAATAIARLFGIARLSADGRERIERAIACRQLNEELRPDQRND